MIADELSEYLGIDNIAFFADNNQERVGTCFKSRTILSAEQLKKVADNYEVIVAAGAEYVDQISEQLRDMAISHTCYNDFPFYYLNKKKVYLYPDDIVKNNSLLSARKVIIWGNTVFAREVQEILRENSVEAKIVGCEQVSCEQIKSLMLENDIDFHILCIQNCDICIGNSKAEKIRKLIIDTGREKVIDCFDQDVMESAFYNVAVRKYKDLYKGQRCFIIGNGPSLQVSDLEYLREKQEITFAANYIYRIFAETNWRPDYYCCVDDLLIKMSINDLVTVDCKDIFLFDYINYPYELEKKENIQYIHVKCMDYMSEGPRFSEDISKEIYMGYTVTYAMLQIACYMGFEEIYLIGMDFSNFNQHFIKDYFDKNMTEKLYTCSEGKVFLAYQSAKAYCDGIGVKIYNATRGGKLEVFDRREFETLF